MMAIDFNGPLSYTESRATRKSNICNGFCINCPNKHDCPYSKIKGMNESSYSDSNELDKRSLRVEGFTSRLGIKQGREYGFSNPNRDYSGHKGEYANNSRGYGISNDSPGFHGSYDSKSPDGGYSGMTPKGGKSNYCSSGGCGKK
jgi:hypothetical protein